MSNNTFINYEGTKGIEGISNNDVSYVGSLDKNEQGTEGVNDSNIEVISPGEICLATLNEPKIKRPTFQNHDDWFRIGDTQFRPGLYYHEIDKSGDTPAYTDTWICSPLHADALTCNEHDTHWGILLRFINANEVWREWAMPSYLLKGNGEEMRGELWDMGVRISPEGHKQLHRWLASRDPRRRIIAAMRTGWHESKQGLAFVLPNRVIGADDIRFQSEYAIHDEFTPKGTLEEWTNEVALPCRDNPILLLSVSAAFAGPLLKIAKLQDIGGAGIHLMGDSSRGKTTALQVATAVWGAPSFMRTWRATANGLEATAASRNDTFLPLDECGESEPKDIGVIIYCLANGIGKQRAKRSGGVREAARWRTMVLSSGECSISTHMSEAGKRSRAGQQARLLDIPATNGRFGAFDCVHSCDNGRAFADKLKRATNMHYGHAGLAFVEKLLTDKQDLASLYANTCKLPEFASNDGVESRAVTTFALIGMAGELATEYGLTGWQEGDALKAAITSFQAWRSFRGVGNTEDRQILQTIRDFILLHGGSRFSELHVDGSDNLINKDRAGWWKGSEAGRVYMFTSPGLRQAVPGFELTKILDVLQKAGWITEHDKDKRSKKTKVNGSNTNLYYIRTNEDDGL